jgi:hypothetical protein
MATSGDAGNSDVPDDAGLIDADNGAGCLTVGGEHGNTGGGGGGRLDGVCGLVGSSAGGDSSVARTASGCTGDPAKRTTRSKKRISSLDRSDPNSASTSSQPMDIAAPGDETRKRGRSAGDDDSLSPGHTQTDKSKKPKEARRRALPPVVRAKPCYDCGMPCLLTDSIDCLSCDKPVHLKCLHVPVAKHVVVAEISSLLSFTCSGCRLEGKQRLAVVEEELLQLRREFTELKLILKNSSGGPPGPGEGCDVGVDPGPVLVGHDKPVGGLTIAERLRSIAGCSARATAGAGAGAGSGAGAGAGAGTGLNYKDTIKLVQRAVVDVARRKRNVVVTGLPDAGSVDSDLESFASVCEANLYIKIRSKVVSVRRLGKPDPNQARLRRLLVTLDCDTTASEVLARAREFRHSSDPYTALSLFVNPDLSPDEESEAYDRRMKRRARAGAATSGLPSTTDGPNYSRPIPTLSGLRTFHRSRPTHAAGSPRLASPVVGMAAVSAPGGGAGRPT